MVFTKSKRIPNFNSQVIVTETVLKRLLKLITSKFSIMLKTSNSTEEQLFNEQPKTNSRRNFLIKAGSASVAASLILNACKKDDTYTFMGGGTDLGSGDVGILNYAYALEQLEAAFYTQVVANSSFSSIFTAGEQSLIKDIRDHEIAHREFFKAALGANAITSLSVNFSTINFGNKASVLGTAKAFEDLGVSAYNGAGQLLVSTDFLLLAGKIVSVEARHAAYIRDLISYNSFSGSDVVNTTTGLDLSRTPAQVLAIAAPFLASSIDASRLPS